MIDKSSSGRPDQLRSVPAGLVRVLAVLAVAPVCRLMAAAWSVPVGRPVRTACGRCHTPIRLAGPVRALSPLASCPGCGSRTGPPPFTVEAALILVVVALVLAARPAVETVAFAWWAGCAVPLVFIDLAVHRLPDRLTYPAAAGTLALLGVAAGLDRDGVAWLRALLAGTLVALFFAATTLLLGRRGFGLGDAKLAFSAVVVLGWLGAGWVVSGLLVTSLGAAVCGLVLLLAGRVRWSDHLPFGPFLVLGTVAALALSG